MQNEYSIFVIWGAMTGWKKGVRRCVDWLRRLPENPFLPDWGNPEMQSPLSAGMTENSAAAAIPEELLQFP